MATKTKPSKGSLVDNAVAQANARLPHPEADRLERVIRRYVADSATEDLEQLDLYGAALAHWHLLQQRAPGEAKVHVYTPEVEEHGWRSPHTVVEIVSDDMPFLV